MGHENKKAGCSGLLPCVHKVVDPATSRVTIWGFPLDRASIEDAIPTCYWHHARFDHASGCTFDLWADDVPTCAVELRRDEVWNLRKQPERPRCGNCRRPRQAASGFLDLLQQSLEFAMTMTPPSGTGVYDEYVRRHY